MSDKNKRKSWIRIAVTLSVVAVPAAAQQEPPPVKVEKIEVTGTNIRRIEGESGLPVQVITRDEIERGGIVTAQDLLERISAHQSFGGWSESKGVGNSEAGNTAASLRGLGRERTLVLLNGRRLAPYAMSGGANVDISGIPASAVERVEVLKDGASAVYGTDAIGGVINFILRKDYEGAEFNATYLGTQHGGGDSWRASVTAGWGTLAKEGFNAFVTLEHLRQDALASTEREYSRTAYLPGYGIDFMSANSVPADISQPGGFRGTFNPSIPFSGTTSSPCLLPYSYPRLTNPRRCGFDYAAVIDDIAKSEKTSLVGRVNWQARPDHQVFAEASYYRGEFVYKVAPTPVNSNFTNTLMTLPPGSPYYPVDFVRSLPGGNPDLPLRLAYRTVELGPRVNSPEVEQWRGILGVQGAASGWDYEMAAGYVANRQVDNLTSGYVQESLFGPLLRSGVVNPFSPNTPEVLARMRETQVTGPASDNRASHYGGELKASGTPWQWASRPVGVAVGLEGRRENLELLSGDLYAANDVIGQTTVGAIPSLTEQSRTVWTAFGEVNVPLLAELEANLAVRYDHYSDFGGTTNPKITLRWQPRKDVVLRGSWGTGFRAPTLYDVFNPSRISRAAITGKPDPVRCPVTGEDTDCADAEYGSLVGGNRELKPETSRQLNAGIVLEPARGLSASLDYYRVKLEDVITSVPVDTIFNDYDRWGSSMVVRKPSAAPYPNLPGPIDYVVQTPVNAGTKDTSGLDLDVRYRFAPTGWGQFTAAITGTYLLTYETSESSDTAPGTTDYASLNGALPRWRHYATLDWSQGPWGATLAQNFQGHYTEPEPSSCNFSTGICEGVRRVGTYSVVDVQARYSGIRNLVVRLGLRNLMDRAPPLAWISNQFQIGYDAIYGDPRGRMFYASVRYAWR